MSSTAIKVDPRLQSALEESGLSYELMETGDFMCEIPSPDGENFIIFASSKTEYFREYEIRGISCAVQLCNGPLNLMWTHRLLDHNARMKMTSWCIQWDKNNISFALVLTGRFPANASGDTLRAFLEEMAEIAISQQCAFELEKTPNN